MTLRPSRGALAALGLALAVTIGGVSYAAQQRAPQPTPLPAPPTQNQVQPAPNRGPDGQIDRRGGRAEQRGNRMERRLDFLHYELRITPAQQRVWDNFADAVRDQSQNMRGRGGRGFGGNRDGARNGGQDGVAGAIARLERRQDRLADRSARLDHLIGTIRPLYAALNDDQKRTADRLLLQARDRGNRGGMERGRGRGGFDRGRFGGRRFGQNAYQSGPDQFDGPAGPDYR